MKRIKINLINEITEYCKYNKIDVNEFVNKCIDIGFNVSKYGFSPIDNMKREKNINKNNILSNEKESTTKKIEENVFYENESSREKNIVNEEKGEYGDKIVRQDEESRTEHKEEIKLVEKVDEVKPKKRKVKIIKN